MIVIIASVLDRKHVVLRVLRHRKSLHAIGYQYPLLSRIAMPYPGKDGQSFFRRNGSTGDSQTLTPKRVQQDLSHETSTAGWRRRRASWQATCRSWLVSQTCHAQLKNERKTPSHSNGQESRNWPSTSPRSMEKNLHSTWTSMPAKSGTKKIWPLRWFICSKKFRNCPRGCRRSALYSVKFFAASLQILEAVAVVGEREGWVESLHVHNSPKKKHKHFSALYPSVRQIFFEARRVGNPNPRRFLNLCQT